MVLSPTREEEHHARINPNDSRGPRMAHKDVEREIARRAAYPILRIGYSVSRLGLAADAAVLVQLDAEVPEQALVVAA